MLAFIAPRLIPPRLPPLRGPVVAPYRPPGTNRLPPTQTAPIYQPPKLLPPTDLNLKGLVCIFANTPIWEPKKIRYRYPGEAWQEIAGESYLIDLLPVSGGNYPATWGIKRGDLLIDLTITIFSGGDCNWPAYTKTATYTNDFDHPVNGYIEFIGTVLSVEWTNPSSHPNLFQCGNNGYRELGPQPETFINIIYKDANNQVQSLGPIILYKILNPPAMRYSLLPTKRKLKKIKFTDITRPDDPPKYQCQFTVFDVFNQVILDIIRDDCPEVIVVPERCYYKAENERLVAKVEIGWFESLRVEYSGNCATVWVDDIIDSFFIPLPRQIYKECTDNPKCPPPRIRLDNKDCEEKCRQCPPGTAVKVLSGGNIICVNAFGCILKKIKFKPGCNNYDCICG